jgi:NitT/TauT family transport system substrate-binding protein
MTGDSFIERPRGAVLPDTADTTNCRCDSRSCTITACRWNVKAARLVDKGDQTPMPVLTRRRFLTTTLATGAAPLFARATSAQTAVKIGSAVLGDYSMAGPVIVALEKGYFKAEGLAAEYVPFRGGPDLLKAVMAGECLIGITGSTDILVFREAGSPIKMIATHTEGNHFTLNVAPDVQKVGELKGKAIGVTRVGATTWVFARMVAKKEGWDPDKDVQVVGLGGLDAQLAAMARKEITAYVWGDGGAVTELQGKSKVLMRLDSVTPKWISQIQYASEDAIARQADAIRKSQKALFRAIKLMRDNPKDVAEIISKKLGWTPEAVLAAHKISGPLLPVDGSINVEALAVMQDTLLEYGLIKKKLPLDAHYTREFTPVRV